jgi:hypothetical protein
MVVTDRILNREVPTLGALSRPCCSVCPYGPIANDATLTTEFEADCYGETLSGRSSRYPTTHQSPTPGGPADITAESTGAHLQGERADRLS